MSEYQPMQTYRIGENMTICVSIIATKHTHSVT